MQGQSAVSMWTMSPCQLNHLTWFPLWYAPGTLVFQSLFHTFAWWTHRLFEVWLIEATLQVLPFFWTGTILLKRASDTISSVTYQKCRFKALSALAATQGLTSAYYENYLYNCTEGYSMGHQWLYNMSSSRNCKLMTTKKTKSLILGSWCWVGWSTSKNYQELWEIKWCQDWSLPCGNMLKLFLRVE